MIQMHIRMIRCHTHHDWLRFDQSEASRLEVKALNNHLSQAQELIRTIPIMPQAKGIVLCTYESAYSIPKKKKQRKNRIAITYCV